MTAITMRDAIIRKYGKGSFEADYIQWVFSRRPTEVLWGVYKELICKWKTWRNYEIKKISWHPLYFLV